MVKKNLTEIIEACENMSHCYEDYLALGRNICVNLSFGDYIYFKYGFQTKHDYEHYFNSINLSREEPSCSNSLRKEEEDITKGEDSSKPSTCSIFKSLFGFSSNRSSKYCDMSANKDDIDLSSLNNKRNKVETKIQEVKYKSTQGGCIREQVEEECNSSFLVGDLRITTQGSGSCMGGEPYFGSNPKQVHKSDLQSPSEPHNEDENKATPLGCEAEFLVEEQATIVSVQEDDTVKNMDNKSS